MAPVPAAPAWLAGVSVWRGEVLPVVCLAALLGLSGHDARRRTLIVLGETWPEVGLLVTAAEDVRSVPEAALRAADALAACVAGLARGVGPDALIVLDSGRLLADPRLRFDDRVVGESEEGA